MGKRSRHKNTAKQLEAIRRQLNIAVFAGVGEDTRRFEQETELVKAAILYGDRVDLFSVGFSFFTDVDVEIEHMTPGGFMEMAVAAGLVDPATLTPETIALLSNAQAVAESPMVPSEMREAMAAWPIQFETSRREMRDAVDKLLAEWGGEELAQAHRAGKVKIHRLVESLDGAEIAENAPQAVLDHLERLSKPGHPPTYPLLTGQMADLMGAAIREGVVGADGAFDRRLRKAGFANGLIARVPNFGAARLDEITDIRTTLNNPLTRFRGEVASFSTAIASAPGTPDYEAEVDEFWLERIQPALQNLDEAVREDRYMTRLQTATVDAWAEASAAGGSAGAATLSLGLGPTAAGIAGVAAAAGVIGGKALAAGAGKDGASSDREFYFLHALGGGLA